MTRAGIYIHIPFCRSRCSYCDFATGLYEGELAERYVSAVCSEIENWREVDEPAPVDTIYFGGGTPSLLSPAQIERLLDAVRSRFALTAGAEITLEINPGDGGKTAAAEQPGDSAHPDATPPHSENQIFQDFRRLGVTRASFGAQTFDDRELKQLGRSHDAKDIGRTFQQLRAAGFANINFDLIAGLPGQTPSGWQRNLKEALKLRPEHLSLYLLDVHEGTPLADQIERGMRPRPDADVAAEMYTTMVETVCTAGYEHYEISNFCLPRFESRHNTKYWSGAPYYGFGCSAHSFDGERRRWANERDALKYVQLIEKTESPVAERTKLNDEDMRSESVFLGLRLMRGIDLQTYRSRFDADLHETCSGELQRLSEAGLIEINDRVLRLTTRGALLSNEVFAALA
jgi:oxygen-independent coproporphyrinogen-3 oxidase